MSKVLNKKIFITSLFFSLVLAWTSQAADTPNIDDALKDLSQATGQQLTTKDEAAQLCNQEKWLTTCADIGKKYNLYSQGQVKQVDTLVSEIKGQIQSELNSCQTTECLVEVAGKLSQKLSAENPRLAQQTDLSSQAIEKKQSILDAAKELGVDFEQCKNMDPDTASVDTLRACAKLAKDARVQQNISQDDQGQAEQGEKAAELASDLKSGQVQCGDGTLESCGNFCLNPSQEARAQGISAIPQVCRDIAQKYFGSEGEQHLEAAYQEVNQTKDSFLQKAQNLTFTTVDGQTITNPQQIGQYMEKQAEAGNVQAVQKGMDFMVNNGLIKPEDKDFALKMVEQVKARGGLPSLDACSQNPTACQNFIPQDLQNQFQAQQQVKQIIQQETGIDPKQCASVSDPSVAQKCLEGAKAAIEKLQSLGDQNSGTQQIIHNLQQNISQREQFQNHQQQLQQIIQQQGGPGGCKSEEECRSFCSDAANGQSCFSFGARQGVPGFQGQDAQQRIQQFKQNFEQFKQGEESPFGQGNNDQNGDNSQNHNFPGQGPFNGFQPPGQGGTAPGQMPGFTEPGRGFSQPGEGGQNENFPPQTQQNIPNTTPSNPSNQLQQPPGGFPGGFQQPPPSPQPQGGTGNFQPAPSGGSFPPPSGGTTNFQQAPPSGGGSQPPPPSPTGFLNNSFFGNLARAFIRISN